MKKYVSIITFLCICAMHSFQIKAELEENIQNISSPPKLDITSPTKLNTKVAEPVQTSTNKNIIEILETMFPTFYSLIRQVPDLATAIENSQGITIFAPTEEAFKKLIDFMGYNPFANKKIGELRQKLLPYIIPSRAMSTDLLKMGLVQPLHGKQFGIKIINGQLELEQGDPNMPNSAMVVHADIIGTNGIVHGIDSVLL